MVSGSKNRFSGVKVAKSGKMTFLLGVVRVLTKNGNFKVNP